MTQIKIEVPANDHIALSAMVDALQRIATERGPQELTPSEMGVTQSDTETYGKAWSEHYGSNTEQLNEELEASIHHENTKHYEAFEDALDLTLDKDGIPHDKRIHSKGATRLADNTWRLRKRPADKTEEEWTTYIDSVKAELKAVQDIPVTTPEEFIETVHIPESVITEVLTSETTLEASFTHHVNSPVNEVEVNIELTPTVTLTEEQAREEIKDKLESGEVTIEAPLTPPVINETPVTPVTPPTSLTPPVVEAPKVTTFQELMLYMTSDAKKRGADNDMIKATLLEVDPALTAIPLIATRADLIPKFVTALEAKLK